MFAVVTARAFSWYRLGVQGGTRPKKSKRRLLGGRFSLEYRSRGPDCQWRLLRMQGDRFRLTGHHQRKRFAFRGRFVMRSDPRSALTRSSFGQNGIRSTHSCPDRLRGHPSDRPHHAVLARSSFGQNRSEVRLAKNANRLTPHGRIARLKNGPPLRPVKPSKQYRTYHERNRSSTDCNQFSPWRPGPLVAGSRSPQFTTRRA